MKLMPKPKFADPNDKGFTHPPLLLIVLVLVGVLVLSKIQFGPKTSDAVKGVLIAKEGSSGDSGSSGSSDGGSHDSGSSQRSGSDSSSSGSGSSGDESSTSGSGGSFVKVIPAGSTFIPKPTEVKKPEVEKIETKHAIEIEVEKKAEHRLVQAPKTELEDEVENELEKPEVAKIEIKGVKKELEVEFEEATSLARHKGHKHGKHLAFGLNKKGIKSKIEFEVEKEGLKIETEGVGATTKFPISLNKQTGELEVKTGTGLKAIRILPAQAAEVAKKAGVQNHIEKIELLENNQTNTADDVIFKVKGQKTGILFGILPVSAQTEAEVGAQTGTLKSVTQPFWLKLLSNFIR